MFSNFGIANGFYVSNNGATVNELLGLGKEREVKIIGYEFFQVVFEEN